MIVPRRCGSVFRTTLRRWPSFSNRVVSRPRVAIVCNDPELRLAVARAFDEAPSQWLVRLFESVPQDADVVVLAPGVDGEGIELDLDAPHDTIAVIESRLAERDSGRLIEVTATGGGTGATSLALHLASFLSGDDPALYVESKTSCGGGLRLGLENGGPSWGDVEARSPLISSTVPVAAGFRALLAPETTTAVPPDVLGLCRSEFRWVVVDRGASTADPEATLEVLLLTPTVPSFRRAAARLRDGSGCGRVLVTNRLGPGSELTTAVLGSILGDVPPGVDLPCSPALRDAEDEGRLLPRHATVWSRRVAKLADGLSRS